MAWLPNAIYQRDQARNQVAVARINAGLAERQGEDDASQIREKARRLSGENRAMIGASGVDISGSFLDAMADSDINAELDAQTALWNSKIDAENYRASARSLSSRGRADFMSGVLGAGARALQGLKI